MTPKLVEVHLACNDWRDGSPVGKASGLEIIAQRDIALALEPITGDTGPVCRITATRLQLGRRSFHIWSHSTWVGNWCWDSVAVELHIAAELLNAARESGWWSPDSGWSSMWERWDSADPFTVSFLQDQLFTGPLGPTDPEQVGSAQHPVWLA